MQLLDLDELEAAVMTAVNLALKDENISLSEITGVGNNELAKIVAIQDMIRKYNIKPPIVPSQLTTQELSIFAKYLRLDIEDGGDLDETRKRIALYDRITKLHEESFDNDDALRNV